MEKSRRGMGVEGLGNSSRARVNALFFRRDAVGASLTGVSAILVVEIFQFSMRVYEGVLCLQEH